MNEIEQRQNELIKRLENADEVILSDYELQLLMYDANDREDNGTYYDSMWFKIYRNIASRDREKYNVMDGIDLNDSELLLLELGKNEEEVKDSINRYYSILKNSKDTIGIKLQKKEIENLLHIIKNYKPSKEENDYYFSNISGEPKNTHIIKL